MAFLPFFDRWISYLYELGANILTVAVYCRHQMLKTAICRRYTPVSLTATDLMKKTTTTQQITTATKTTHATVIICKVIS